jgi:hypothetical protein
MRTAMKLRLSVGAYRTARRVRAVDAYEFPSSVRQRLRRMHPDLGTEGVVLIEAATRQWFRILARRPTTRLRLSMPSMLADDMWHEFLLHTRDYAAFCDTAFGRFLHHIPESAMTPDEAVASPTSRLLATLRLAREDENNPSALPMLFRVDHEAGLHEARRYVVKCGGQEECSVASSVDLVCLYHLVDDGSSDESWGCGCG